MRNYLLAILFAVLLLASCGHKSTPTKVDFSRLEQLLFTTPPSQLSATLLSHADEYNTPLLNLAPNNPEAMLMLSNFVADPGMRHIYTVVDSLYHDLAWLERDLGQAIANAAYLMPDLNYQHFYTLITGDFDDYSKRIFCDQTDLAISLDHYSVNALGNVVPAYIARLCQPEYIVPDCIGAIAAAHISLPATELTLLDYAIAEGKKLYLIEKAIPSLPDTLLLRYSPAQLQWAEANVAKVWGTLIREQLLYNHNYQQFHNLIDEAPKTNAFGDGSAPRMPAYIGLQIIRRYAKKTGCTYPDLFANTNSQQILATSGWRP